MDVFKGHIALSIRQAADDPTLQTLDSLTSKVETTTDAGGLERVPIPVQQLLIRLSSVKDVRSIKVEQVVDGPAQSQTLQVWLGKEEPDAGQAALPVGSHRAAIRSGSRIVVVTVDTQLSRADMRDVLKNLSS